MIRKHITSLTMFMALACLASCIDDKGNYTYIPSEDMLPISISVPEIDENDDFIRAVKGEELHLTAKVSGLDGSDKYSFLWYAFPNNTNATTDERIELARSQNLDLPSVMLRAGEWLLCFKVTDNELGIFKENQYRMTVSSSSFSRGWYIMKAKDGYSDVDYFPANYPAEGVEPTRDIIALSGYTLAGNPVDLAWQENNYCHPVTDEYGTTSIELLEAWHFLSDHDALVLQGGGDMTLLKDYDEQFYTAPDSRNPQAFLFIDTSNHQILIDGGNLYGVVGTAFKYVGTMTPRSIGKYTLKPSDHTYYPAVIPYTSSSDVLLYDTKTKGFYRYLPNSSSSNVSTLASFQLNGEFIEPSNLNSDIIKYSRSLNSSPQVYILTHELSNDKYRLIKMVYAWGSKSIPFDAYNEVPAGSLLLQCDYMATPGSGDLVYFNHGNEIYYYRDAPGLDEREFKLFDVPTDEQITHMQCNSGNGGNYLIIMTSKGNEWKCYFHLIPNVGQPEVNTTPDMTLTGEGVASRLMYKAW